MGNLNELIAVFRDEPTARTAAAELRDRLGVADEAIRVGARDDRVAAVRNEMREESELAAPVYSGAWTKEMQKGLVTGIAIGAVCGAVVAAPAAFIHMASFPFHWRLVVTSIVGALAGSVIGFVAGGGFAAGDGGDTMASQEGVVLAVADDRVEVERALERHHPARIDLVRPDGDLVRTVTTEEHRQGGGIVQDLGTKLQQGTGY